MEYQQICELIKSEVKEADYVIIGFGEEWSTSKNLVLNNKQTKADLNGQWLPTEISEAIQLNEYYKMNCDSLRQKGFKSLHELVKDKDYFAVSVNLDQFPIQYGFENTKCVFPCGSYKFLQCPNNCQNEIYDLDVLMKYNNEKQYYCPHCNEILVPNNVYAKKYNEIVYQQNWDDYLKWLQKTINRKVVLLELGVSLAFPTVIRNAFEKTTFYNHKAKLFRINETIFDKTEIIKDKTISLNMNSVDFISKLFVTQ